MINNKHQTIEKSKIRNKSKLSYDRIKKILCYVFGALENNAMLLKAIMNVIYCMNNLYSESLLIGTVSKRFNLKKS